MLNGARAGYVPGGYEAVAQAPVPQVQGNAEILDFLRQLSTKPQFAGTPDGGAGGNGVRLMRPPSRAEEANAEFTRQMQQLQLRKAQGEQMDADAIRNMRKAPVNSPGQSAIYGLQYDYDLRGATPAQQRAVTPENASFSAAGAQDDAIRSNEEDAEWGQFLRDIQMRQQVARRGGL